MLCNCWFWLENIFFSFSLLHPLTVLFYLKMSSFTNKYWKLWEKRERFLLNLISSGNKINKLIKLNFCLIITKMSVKSQTRFAHIIKNRTLFKQHSLLRLSFISFIIIRLYLYIEMADTKKIIIIIIIIQISYCVFFLFQSNIQNKSLLREELSRKMRNLTYTLTSLTRLHKARTKKNKKKKKEWEEFEIISRLWSSDFPAMNESNYPQH